jgi:hypothetical protein
MPRSPKATRSPARCDKVQNCQLPTLTASQLAGVLALLASGAILIWSAFPDSTSVDSARGLLRFGVTLMYLAIITYYFVGSWELEEGKYKELRQLRPWHRRAELTLRVILLFLTVFSLAFYTDLIGPKKWFDPYGGTLFLSMCVFWLFLVWDTVVAFGTPNGIDIVKVYAGFDFGGFIFSFFALVVEHPYLELFFMLLVFVGLGIYVTFMAKHLRSKFTTMR